MTSQNMPGIAVLRADGYSVPASPLITTTGVASRAELVADKRLQRRFVIQRHLTHLYNGFYHGLFYRSICSIRCWPHGWRIRNKPAIAAVPGVRLPF